MQATLSKLRENYFSHVINKIAKENLQCIILTHLLEDRPELLNAIDKIARISLVIGIPYSIHQPTLQEIRKLHHVETPKLSELYDTKYLNSLIMSHAKRNIPLILIEIGGYFSSILDDLQKKLSCQLLGVIEDTEAGHRRYESSAKRQQLPCPVISVARSVLKAPEDFLVGPSCLYSTERILRTQGIPINGKQSLTLGFGKIGRGVAHSLLKHHCSTSVYDTDPVKRIIALSEGFCTPDRELSISHADIIFGATGNNSISKKDFNLIKNGTLLVSCSSKDIEFDLYYLKENYNAAPINNELCRYENGKQFFYLAANGNPINFTDGAVIGPALALVQSELLIAIRQLLVIGKTPGLFETDMQDKKLLAEIWLEHFCDKQSGNYRIDQENKLKVESLQKVIA